MQDYRTINSNFSVAGALSSGDMDKISQMGFSTVISNLPDEEAINGFSSDIAKAQAKSLGLNYVYFPVTGLTLTEQDTIDRFAQILTDHPSPVLIHCRSGSRSALLWGLASSQVSQPAKILSQLDKAGFEFDYLDEEFEEQWELASAKSAALIPAAAQAQTVGIHN